MKFNFTNLCILVFCIISSVNAKAGGGGSGSNALPVNQVATPFVPKNTIPGYLNKTELYLGYKFSRPEL